MHTAFVPRDVPKFATNGSSELNDSIRVLNFTRSGNNIIDGTVSHTIDEDNSSFTNDLNDSGPLNYISCLTIIDEEDEMAKEYPEHDIPGEMPISLSHNFLDVTTEDVKQFVASPALKKMSIFQKNHAAI